MPAAIKFYKFIEKILQHLLMPPLLPLMARLVFAATLLFYFYNSALTKFGNSLLSPSIGAYAQILPQKAAMVNYNPTAFNWFDWLIVTAGTYAEIILPILILIGLMTRLAAIGMIGFVIVMTYVDITGHHVMVGALFDGNVNGVIDQRLIWVFLLVVIAATGAGRISLDYLISHKIKSNIS